MYVSLREVFIAEEGDDDAAARSYTGKEVDKIVKRELKKVHASHS
jgi:hypothetical protein